MNQERAAAMTQIERSIRRGELAEALTLLEMLVRQDPTDRRMAERLEAVRQLADPTAIRAPAAAPMPPQPLRPEQPPLAAPRQPLPRDPVALLEVLMRRVQENRRPG